jgi:hypothetical protein
MPGPGEGFLLAQEREGFLFSGKVPHGDIHVVDTAFETVEALSELFKNYSSYVKPEYRKEFGAILSKADPQSRMIACTRLASDREKCLSRSVKVLLFDVSKRLMPSPTIFSTRFL